MISNTELPSTRPYLIRALYDWCIEQLGIFPSHQYEFARLNLTYVVLSKRKLIELVENKKVYLRATVFQFVTIDMKFYLTENGTRTGIEEQIHIQTWLPIRRIMHSIFKKMHHQLMQNIEEAYQLKISV